MNRFIRMKALAAAALLGSAALAHAAFPEKPIRLVVPFPPGGTTDVVARRISVKVGEILGQTVVVENKGGAGGTIATDMVAKSPADGYTLIMATNSHTANPAIYRKLPFDTQKDFVSVAMIADTPGLLVVHPSVPVSNFKEFIELARKSDPPLTFGTAGAGTFPHLSIELLKSRAGIQMTHVPYKGAGPAMVDLIAGVYQVKVDALPTAGGHIKAGKLKLLAVTSLERMPQLPDVPSIAELGYPGYESTFWMAILAPAGTPKDVVSKLEQAFIKAVRDKDIADKLVADGVRIIAKPASAVDALIARELKQWPPIVKQAGISAN
ncbi:MAG TPA: tripartite tricarboxylate transporter substrate binding protein [Burkholderiales bacterium]